MINMNLSRAAHMLGVDYRGRDVEFSGCSTDSRSISPGELFIAIRGERFDGHDFLQDARQRGAVAALIESEAREDLPALTVSDTRRAMGELAQHWRNEFEIPVVAITGSNGKTTVREMLTSILGLKATVLASRGNFNNDIGVPLTLFGLGREHAYAIIEMGANHPGEIHWLSRIARPTVAVITQCAPAHLEGFGSIEGVARAKAEIYDGLDQAGLAIINADDAYAGMWREKIRQFRQLSFGMQQPADISASSVATPATDGGSCFLLNTARGAIEISLPLPGRHNIMNALAAATCAIGLGVELDIIKQGLERMKPVKGRLQIKTGLNNARIIDDTYNANPASLEAAINVLNTFAGKHWLVLGDMGELGVQGEQLHTQAGEQARNGNVDRLFALGTLSQHAAVSFGHGAEHFATAETLAKRLQTEITPDVTLLVKGSRAMQMERIVNALERNNAC